jgi:DNA-binding SARP family transcriptional activator/tetratricopeptide (TPR) repeat protein
VEFRILGALEVVSGGRKLQLGGLTSQRIIGGLLLSPNRVVTMGRLAEMAWDVDPPATSRRQLQNRIATMRSLLARNGGVIETHDAGYLIRVGPDELDAAVFARLIREAHDRADPRRRREILRRALALWRGPALAGLGGIMLGNEAAALEDRRLAALGDCLDAELDLGEHGSLVPELRQLVAEHPLRERFVGQWMTALCRSGRQSEALEAYRLLRGRLVDELGIEPGPGVRELHQAILRGDEPAYGAPASAAAPAAPAPQRPVPLVPRQLPADVRAFVGRERELAQIQYVLTGTRGSGPVPIVAIHGPGGVGKSALTIHAAHRMAGHFPDGQLYVDLQGSTAGMQPLPPEEVLGRFLRALGVDGRQIPTTLEEAAARYRSELASRQFLVVLDNAGDAAQIMPLLPGAATCGVLVTSRAILSSAEPVTWLQLGFLSAGEATMQLQRAIGSRRIADDPAAAADVARWCGCLPLALRIAGARLAARPTWPLRRMAVRLADEQRRLDELELPDVSVRATIAVSHEALGDSTDDVDWAAARAFVALSLLDGPDIGLLAAARVLGQPEDRAERVLERLVDTALLESPAVGRYRLHDLVRLYARERAAATFDSGEQTAAIIRPYRFYVATTWQAFGLIRPGDERPARADPRWSSGGLCSGSATDALNWLEAERPNLIAAVRQSAAAQAELAPVAIQLAHALYAFFRLRGYWNEVAEVNEIALALIGQCGDRASRAIALSDLGTALGQHGQYTAAVENFSEAIAIHRELGDRYGQAQSLISLGVVYKLMGRRNEALSCYEQSQAICEELGNARGQAMALDNLGALLRQEGMYDKALAYHQRAIAIFRELHDRYGQAVGMTDLGLLYTRMGRYGKARAALDECLGIYRDMGDRSGEAEALSALGVLHREQEKHNEALLCQEESLAIYRELGRRGTLAASLRELGLTLYALGRQKQAVASWREAARILDDLQSAEAAEVRALIAEGPSARRVPVGSRPGG